MAVILKCTKITNQGDSLLVTGAYQMKVDYVNPATTPPTPGSVTLQVPYALAEDPSEIQSMTDDALLLVGSNSMDWSI